LRILFLTPWYPTPDHIYTGIFVREHAKAVRALGHDVVVIHTVGVEPDGSGLWSVEAETNTELTDGIPTYRVLHRHLPFRTTYFLHVLSAFKAFREPRSDGFRPDVIHSHTYGPGVAAVLLGVMLRRPVVITEHFSGFPRRALDAVELAKARFCFRRASCILPVSEYLRDAIVSYGIRGDYQVVRNAVDTSIFFPDVLSTEDHEWKTLLFVGSLNSHHGKGFPTLIDALRLMQERRTDWHLEVVGSGPARRQYERAVEIAGLSDFVSFHGARPKRDIAEMMRAADVFVLPSRYDNLPCAVIEALASGLPVVATRVGGIPEIVDERSGVLVPPEEPRVLASTLDQVLSNLTEFDPSAIAASARSRYGLSAIGSQLDAVYRSVLSDSRQKNSSSAP
jgi:glycosyltransferase involved in cell wall biosynthesis